ncbi:alpha/beta fold hydrolase, partial [archaeon]|nr:alpha/beta fold hydrolase [archaeon]
GYLDMVENLISEGYCCVIFNFRGCGLSEGNIDMKGWYDDLSAVADKVRALPGIDPSSIHCIAFSAGGAVATKLASRENLFRSLLLMATPDDFTDILPDDAMLLKQHFRSIGIIREETFPPDISSWYHDFLDLKATKFISFISPNPVGIVHGDKDETVPPEHALRLFAAACNPKKLMMLNGASHQLRKDPRTIQIIKDWLKENSGRL